MMRVSEDKSRMLLFQEKQCVCVCVDTKDIYYKRTQPHSHTLDVYDTLQTDYCSQLWCPVQTGDIQALEMSEIYQISKI